MSHKLYQEFEREGGGHVRWLKLANRVKQHQSLFCNALIWLLYCVVDRIKAMFC